MIQCPLGSGVTDNQNPPSIPGCSHFVEEVIDSFNDLPVALTTWELHIDPLRSLLMQVLDVCPIQVAVIAFAEVADPGG